jgi:hypothetical protein
LTFSAGEDMNRAITGYYKSLYTEEESWRPSIQSMPLPSLSDRSAASLVIPFSEEEITKALYDCDNDKAPGPDGFTLEFVQANWAVLKNCYLDAFKDFFNNSSFVRSLNATHVVLIPKKHGATNIKDYRPISLIGNFYKILS